MTETTAPVVAAAGDDDRQPTPTPATAAAAAATPPADGSTGRRWARHPVTLIGGLVLVAGVIPMVVALVNLRDPQWYPAMDQALIELQVRDVGDGHLPLVGLEGRISGHGESGYHPGPLMFWFLFPVYWLLGGGGWGLQVATAVLNVLAMLGAVWIGYRRGGPTLALGIAITVMVLARSYGIEKLTVVWNPYMPMLWWVVFMLAVWSVLCDDFAALPVAVFAGSFCIQTHYPYLGVIGVLGVVTAVAVVASVTKRRADADVSRRRVLVRWAVPSVALLGLLWIGPIVEQLTNDPGNLSVLGDAIRHPTNERLVTQEPSAGHTAEIWLAHLNVGTLLSHTDRSIVPAPETPILPGLLLVGVWIVVTAIAWRRQRRELRRLNLTVAAALVAGFASIHGITGDTWDYLVLWAWGTTALLVLATILGLGALVRRGQAVEGDRAPTARWPSAPRPVVGALALALATVTVAFTYDAARAEYGFAAAQSELISRVAPSTVDALRRGDLPGQGDGRYLVVWDQDAWWSGMAGSGFFDELERSGFDVGVRPAPGTLGESDHRILDSADAEGVIHLVIGSRNIEQWETTPGAIQVAYYEPRTEEEVEEYERLALEVKAIFRDHDRPDLVTLVDSSLFLTSLVRPPVAAEARIERMMALGLPAAVFVAPADVQPSA